jgi:hypothetical protein
MIKIKNVRDIGYLFHYSHFLSDCLIPEIGKDIHNYDLVIRPKYLSQALGNFTSLYEFIMDVENIELPIEEYDKLDIEEKVIVGCNGVYDNSLIYKSSKYILSRYNIKKSKYYPPVIIIDRGERVELIKNDLSEYGIDPEYKSDQFFNDKYLANGKERREINSMDGVRSYLDSKRVPYKTLILENLPFEEQLKYFHNANLVIGAHGAGLCNLMFCKKNTTVVEILPLRLPMNIIKNSLYWFKNISHSSNLKYYSVLDSIQEITNLLDGLQANRI